MMVMCCCSLVVVVVCFLFYECERSQISNKEKNINLDQKESWFGGINERISMKQYLNDDPVLYDNQFGFTGIP